ncbi:uncharacterized protein G2W53_020901 [Senna tora]|uniref:Uncharacterized protein n=1 Tax=Senna tora TaxID=362788 RepID=A0A834WHC9_9FABA|nr:uncharacterized protein G2W53_020901 [Senna tora]
MVIGALTCKCNVRKERSKEYRRRRVNILKCQAHQKPALSFANIKCTSSTGNFGQRA